MVVPNIYQVEMDITYLCNLHCADCNRGISVTRYDPAWDMTPKDVAKHLAEAEACGHEWKTIRILGGEPTLHPKFREIIGIILSYAIRHDTLTWLVSNGYGKKVQKELEWARSVGVSRVESTEKNTPAQPTHIGFTQAPADLPDFKGEAKPCDIPQRCGISLNKLGYYSCAPASTIARIFQLNTHIEHIKDVTPERLMATYQQHCLLCGHSHRPPIQKPSRSWRMALQQYNETMPKPCGGCPQKGCTKTIKKG